MTVVNLSEPGNSRPWNVVWVWNPSFADFRCQNFYFFVRFILFGGYILVKTQHCQAFVKFWNIALRNQHSNRHVSGILRKFKTNSQNNEPRRCYFIEVQHTESLNAGLITWFWLFRSHSYDVRNPHYKTFKNIKFPVQFKCWALCSLQVKCKLYEFPPAWNSAAESLPFLKTCLRISLISDEIIFTITINL